MADQAPDLPERWWASPALSRLWAAVTERLEREGLLPRGRVTVAGLDRVERRAVSDLLGRSVLAPTVRVDLEGLDVRLRKRAGLSLVEAAQRVAGRDLIDLPAKRALQTERRQAPEAAYEAWALAHPGLDWPWLQDWLEGMRRDGVLGRDADPARLVRTSLDILWHQRAFLSVPELSVPATAAYPSPVARTELAARLVGDAHALDDDRRLAAAVLRAADARAAHLGDSARAGSATGSARGAGPAGAHGAGDGPDAGASGRLAAGQWVADQDSDRSRRALWEELGVLTDRVSSTCLTFGLRVRPDSAAGARVAAYAAVGAVVHLTWRDLDEGLAFEPGQDVLVCENPRVLEAAAELAGGPDRDERLRGTRTGEAAAPRPRDHVAIVCTSGRPALVTHEVLAQLRAGRCRLRYHGDFDWAGVAMANDLVRRCGVIPWRMSAEDYLGHPAVLALSGQRVDALWDPELGPAMARRALAVHEEATLPDLVSELLRPEQGLKLS